MSRLTFSLFSRLPYESYIGGVFGIREKAFKDINGFSNLYFGWGREDDDLRERYGQVFVCYNSVYPWYTGYPSTSTLANGGIPDKMPQSIAVHCLLRQNDLRERKYHIIPYYLDKITYGPSVYIHVQCTISGLFIKRGGRTHFLLHKWFISQKY